MLLYIKKEEWVGKNHMIYALKIGFNLLNRRNKLIFLALIKYAAKGIGKSTVYIDLSISIYKIKSLYTNISQI